MGAQFSLRSNDTYSATSGDIIIIYNGTRVIDDETYYYVNKGSEVIWYNSQGQIIPEPIDPKTLPLTFTANTANSTVTLNQTGTAPWSGYYSTDDGDTWVAYTLGTTITLAAVDDTVCFKGTLSAAQDTSNYLQFALTGTIASSNNVMSLCSGDDFEDVTTLPYDYCFYRLFYKCNTNLTAAPKLPAMTLTDSCYYDMFAGCGGLTTAPALPATTLAPNCYRFMFDPCNHLTTAPALPATTLTEGCYYGMFIGCTGLTSIPELPATTLVDSCYYRMFERCTGLTSVDTLPATTLAHSCYCRMFASCTSLTSAPTLPATTLADDCYDNMFGGCTSLESAPELPATILSASCYWNMFNGCTSLTTAPELPATNLAYCCYRQMFMDCTALTEAPELPATTLAGSCYQSMFKGCTSLINAPIISATSLSGKSCYEMFSGCTSLRVNNASTGTLFFTCPSTIPADAVTNMFYGTGGSYTSDPVADGTYYYEPPLSTLTFTADTAGSTVTLGQSGTAPWTGSYSTDDGSTWSSYTLGTTITLAAINDSVCFKGTYSAAPDNSNYLQFTMTGSIASSGNIMSLCSGDSYNTVTTIPYTYCFCRLFQDCTSLTTAPSLPATTLANYCYYRLFYNCTSITSTPELPAEALTSSCYRSMFGNCTSLAEVSELPITTLADYCCYYMLSGCTSLKVSNSTGTQFFTCPSTIPSAAVNYMFQNTGGTYISNPVADGTYYYY